MCHCVQCSCVVYSVPRLVLTVLKFPIVLPTKWHQSKHNYTQTVAVCFHNIQCRSTELCIICLCHLHIDQTTEQRLQIHPHSLAGWLTVLVLVCYLSSQLYMTTHQTVSICGGENCLYYMSAFCCCFLGRGLRLGCIPNEILRVFRILVHSH